MKAGWEVRPLGEVCGFQGGTQPPKSEFVDSLRAGYVRLLQIRDFKSDDKAVFVRDNGKVKKCAETDIMIGRYGASVGQIHRGKAGAYNVALVKTIPDLKVLDRDYFYYFLTSDLFQVPLIEKKSRGAQDGFNQEDIAPFLVPLPPLEEQQRIVAVLDEAFEGLTRARTHAEANLQNARELFESALFDLYEVKLKDTHRKSLDEVCDLISGQHIDASDYNHEEVGIGYLTGPSDFGHRYPIVTKWTEKPKRTAREGDILITVKGSGVGSVNIMNCEELAISRQLMAIRTRSIPLDYLFGFIRIQQPHFQRLSNGAAIPGISRGDVLALKIPIPERELQVLYVEYLSGIEAMAIAAQDNYTKKVQSLDALRQSLLQKAFAGELT